MYYNFLEEKSKEIRKKVIDYHARTKISHVGCALSSVEIMTVLGYFFMKKEDSFILSKGHSSGILYSILNDQGFITEEEMYKLEEHPTLNKKYRIEATTGSLGHGLSIGIGIAIADKGNKSIILMGDGECDEGQVWEAARVASELNLKNIVAIVDCNGFQGFRNSIQETLDKKFEAFGWEVRRCNGHNCEELLKVLSIEHDKPLIILADTIIGKGLPHIENQLKSHYSCN